MNNEIIIYQPQENLKSLEVLLEDDTVWLTQAQIVELFNSSKSNISEHIKHIFQTNELLKEATVRKFRTVQTEGKRKVARYLTYYNLDVIISVGYRVNTYQGTQFRIWANKVLKEYLLKGYAVNKRIDRIEDDISQLKDKIQEFDLQIRSNLPPNQGIFYDGQIFDAYVFICDLIKSAKKNIVLIDNYIDESVLKLFTKRNNNVSADIYTPKITKVLQQDLDKHNTQHPPVKMHTFKKSHDRFLIIDNKMVYHFGASLKDLGKKWFAFSKMKLDAKELLAKLNKDI